jgi:exopolyphosphatase/guanosine-5'-triphosphate,3'-diphosphate pyrophosphatase
MIAIDLGSNTIRFIEYDGISWGRSYEKIVRAAEFLHSTNKICEDALLRIFGAIDEAKSHLDFANNEVVAVTTAALRTASNGNEIIARIYEYCGIEFKIINGDQEAHLTLMAVKNRLNELQINPTQFLLADIGGGSTELIVCDHEETNTISLAVGIVTMSEKAVDMTMLHSLLHDFETKVSHFHESFDCQTNLPLVLTSGTPTTIAAYRMGMDYANYDPIKINGTILTRIDCVLTYEELMMMDESMRAMYVGIGREQLIATGILMVESLFKGLNLEEAIIIDDGLREGVALNYFSTKSFT